MNGVCVLLFMYNSNNNNKKMEGVCVDELLKGSGRVGFNGGEGEEREEVMYL